MTNIINLVIKNQPVFLDTSCFIYTLEQNPAYLEIIKPIFNCISDGEIKAVSSTMSLSEVVAKPFRESKTELVETYKSIFAQTKNLELVTPPLDSALLAGKIRGKYGFGLIDSFQIALAESHRCKLFLTNDKQLKKYKGVKIVLLEDFVN